MPSHTAKQRTRFIVQLLGVFARLIDAGALTTIFSMFLHSNTQRFMDEIGKYILFPLAASAHAATATLSIITAFLSKKEPRTRNIVSAVLDSLVAAIVATAVIGGLVESAFIFVVLTPFLFALAVGMKTVSHLLSGFYFAGRAASETDKAKKAEFVELAWNHFFATPITAAATAAIVAVMVLGFEQLAPLGIAAGASAALLLSYQLGRTARKWVGGGEPEYVRIDDDLEVRNDFPSHLTNNASMHRTLSGNTLTTTSAPQVTYGTGAPASSNIGAHDIRRVGSINGDVSAPMQIQAPTTTAPATDDAAARPCKSF